MKVNYLNEIDSRKEKVTLIRNFKNSNSSINIAKWASTKDEKEKNAAHNNKYKRYMKKIC